jgi:hypothetical protein
MVLGSISSVVPVSAMAWCGADVTVVVVLPTEKPLVVNYQKPLVVLTSRKESEPVNSVLSMKPKL